jgi:catabolite regulation protein CreA
MEKTIKRRTAKFVLFIKYYVDHKKDDEVYGVHSKQRSDGSAYKMSATS